MSLLLACDSALTAASPSLNLSPFLRCKSASSEAVLSVLYTEDQSYLNPLSNLHFPIMERERDKPPSYSSHDPNTLNLPSVPQGIVAHSDASTLDFRNVRSSFQESPTIPILSAAYHPDAFKGQLPPDQQYSPTSPSRTTNMHQRPASDVMSPRSMMSLDDLPARASSVSMDDPDVRIAAEALSGLGNPGTLFCSQTFGTRV